MNVSLCSDEESLSHTGRAFFDATLPRHQWTHDAHLVAGTWLLLDRGFADACRVMPGRIRAYNLACDVANTDDSGYHETLTLANLAMIATIIDDARAWPSLVMAVKSVRASRLNISRWPFEYWSPARLWSPLARRNWCEPDIQPLPLKPAFTLNSVIS